MGELLAAEGAGDAKAWGAEADEFFGRGGARGLEAEQDADGFEEGGFALGVVAGEEGDRSLQGAGKRLEAAEVSQAEGGEHGGGKGIRLEWERGGVDR